MPRKKKTARQLAQIKRHRQYESIDRFAKKVLEIWARGYEDERNGKSISNQ